MKNTVLLICGMIAMAFGVEANAQPFSKDELYDPIGKLSKGSFSEFVSWMLAEPEDELNGPLSEAWNLYRKNKPLGKGTTIVLDEKNGYFRYELDFDKKYEGEEGDLTESVTIVEMCVWNCADGKHKLFAEYIYGTIKGKPHVDGQFDGLQCFVYDKASHELYGFNGAVDWEELSSLAPYEDYEFDGEHWCANDHVTGKRKQMDDDEFSQWLEDRTVAVLSLPRTGKNIIVTVHSVKGITEKEFVWDGYRFHLAK